MLGAVAASPVLAGTAFGQPPPPPPTYFAAEASFSGQAGPTGTAGPQLSFFQATDRYGGDSPTIERFQVIRPAEVRVTAPPSAVTLGSLYFYDSPRTATNVGQFVPLRRMRSLGNGDYLLASRAGIRVTFSTRYRTRFIDVSVPSGTRNVAVYLTGRGARLLRPVKCATASFEGRFTGSQGVTRDADYIPGQQFRRAKLC